MLNRDADTKGFEQQQEQDEEETAADQKDVQKDKFNGYATTTRRKLNTSITSLQGQQRLLLSRFAAYKWQIIVTSIILLLCRTSEYIDELWNFEMRHCI